MKTVMSFKVDKDVRDRARRVAKEMGLPLSTVINQQLKRFIRDEGIEFMTTEAYQKYKKMKLQTRMR